MKTKTTIMKKISALLIVCLLLPNCLVLSASAVSDNLLAQDGILFDADYYYAKYPDLQQAIGKDASALYSHYCMFGKKEGRCPSELFDPVYYANKYSDLKAAFGSDYTQLLNHFITYGIKEGRQGSATFNVTIYKNNYSDLRNAFGTSASDNWKYLKHWREHGKNEHRNAVSEIQTASANSASSSTSSSSGTVGYVKTTYGGNLNLRSTASTSGKILAKLANGTQVTVYSTNNGWCKVRANNVEGYVSAQYITYTTPSSNTNSNTGTSTTLTNALYNINVSSSYITCGFDGYTTTSGRHEGIDLKRGLNEPVYSLTDGVITRVAYGSTGRNGLSTIAIYNSASDKTVVYLHTKPISGLYVGQTISRGQQIATESWRGVSSQSSAHTHVEVRSGRRTAAAISLKDPVLDNENPTSFWNSLGYKVY